MLDKVYRGMNIIHINISTIMNYIHTNNITGVWIYIYICIYSVMLGAGLSKIMIYKNV